MRADLAISIEGRGGRVSLATPDALVGFVCRQLAHVIPDGHDARAAVATALPAALQRTRRCIAGVRAWQAGDFDPLVSGQYASFLYLLGNELWARHDDAATATRLFLLNKSLHGLELFHEVELPEVFFLSHTPGLVFAKASYGNRLVVHQACTIGRKVGGERPVLGERVVLFPGSMVIGCCHVRDGSVVAPGVCLVDTDTPGDCYVLPGPEGRPLFKPVRREVWKDYLVA
jgi:serine O-acetyltransferase